jgi:hypothetical protein
MRITDSVPGSIAISEYGIFASFGVSAISDMFIKNIISEKLRWNTFYMLSKPSHTDLIFHVERWIFTPCRSKSFRYIVVNAM